MSKILCTLLLCGLVYMSKASLDCLSEAGLGGKLCTHDKHERSVDLCPEGRKTVNVSISAYKCEGRGWFYSQATKELEEARGSGTPVCTCDDCKPFGDKHCRGDSDYCTRHSCDPRSNCVCWSGGKKSYVSAKHCRVGFCRVVEQKELELNVVLPEEPQVRRGETRTQLGQSPSCTFREEARVLYVRCNQDLTGAYVVANKGPVVEYVNSSEFSIRWPIPFPKFFYTSGHMSVTIWTGRNQPCVGLVWVPAVSTCEINQEVGWENFRQNVSCFSLPWKILFWTMWISSALSLILCVLWMFRALTKAFPRVAEYPGVLLFGVLSVPKNVWKTKLVVRCRGAAYAVYLRVADELSTEAETKMKCILLLLILPLVANACDQNPVIPVHMEACTTNGLEKTCQMTLNAIVDLPRLGSMSCLTLTSSNEVVGFLNLTYTDMMVQISTKLEYFSSNWTGVQESRYRCPGTDMCGYEVCSNIQPDDPTSGGHFSGVVSKWPGKSGCYTGGTGHTGCLWQAQAGCIYYRYAKFPSDYSAIVHRPIRNAYLPSIKAVYADAAGNAIKEETIVAADPFNFGTLSVSLIGSYESNMAYLSDRAFISMEGRDWIVPAAPANSPLPSMVGDLQSNSNPLFLSGSPNAFLVTPEPVNLGPEFAATNFHLPGMEFRSSWVSMPGIYGGDQFFGFGPQSVWAQLTNPGAISISVISSQAQTISYISTLVNPSCEFVSADGCYLCPTGFRATLRCYSTTAPGTALVSVSSGNCTLNQGSISLDIQEGLLNVTGLCYAREPGLSIRILGTAGEQSLPVPMTLTKYNPIDENATNTGHPDLGGSKSGWNISWKGLGDWITGAFIGKSWWSSLIVYLVGVLIVVGFCIIIYFLGPPMFAILRIWKSRAMSKIRKSAAEKSDVESQKRQSESIIPPKDFIASVRQGRRHT